MEIAIRQAILSDDVALLRIKNYYIANTAITFDTVVRSVEVERCWIAEHSKGVQRCLVATDASGNVVAYAAASQFRQKPAYDTTIETSVYCDPHHIGLGVGSKLLNALLKKACSDHLHRAVAFVALPNDASLNAHLKRCGFKIVGTLTEVGFKLGQWHDVAVLEKALVSTSIGASATA